MKKVNKDIPVDCLGFLWIGCYGNFLALWGSTHALSIKMAGKKKKKKDKKKSGSLVGF